MQCFKNAEDYRYEPIQVGAFKLLRTLWQHTSSTLDTKPFILPLLLTVHPASLAGLKPLFSADSQQLPATPS